MRRLLMYGLLLVEPLCHAFAIPHPEGFSSLVLNHLATQETSHA